MTKLWLKLFGRQRKFGRKGSEGVCGSACILVPFGVNKICTVHKTFWPTKFHLYSNFKMATSLDIINAYIFHKQVFFFITIYLSIAPFNYKHPNRKLSSAIRRKAQARTR